MLENILPEFQKFLTSCCIANEKHAPFYAVLGEQIPRLLEYQRKLRFLEQLSNSTGIEDWQKELAEN